MVEIHVLSWAFFLMGKFPLSEEMDHLFKNGFLLHDKWVAEHHHSVTASSRMLSARFGMGDFVEG